VIYYFCKASESKLSLIMQILNKLLEPVRFDMLLGDDSRSEFEGSFLLSNSSFFLLFSLFFGDLGFSISLGGSILLLVLGAVRGGSVFAEFDSSGLVSRLVFLEGSDDLLSSLVRAEELLSAESLDVRVKLDHHS